MEKISFDEFCACVGDSLIDDIQKKMTVAV